MPDATFGGMVSVTFVDAGSGAVIGRSEMPPERLPETFATTTTLEIAGSRYFIERAEPPHATPGASGELTLFLRPVQVMSPKDILFSLPTICDRVPQADPVLESDHLFEMHEDDWRQIEFVDVTLAPVVEEQRRLIREVVDHHSRRDGDGRPIAFDRLHVRAEPVDPLPRGITVRRLVEVMDADEAFSGVGFQGRPYLVPRSFAFRAGSLVCYGLVVDGLVKVLGLNRMPDTDLSFEGTVLVNWLARPQSL